MKYTNYLINKDFVDVDQILSDKLIFKHISIVLAISVASMGVIIIGGMIPIAVVADTVRSMRYEYYKVIKKYKHYHNVVLNSLAIPSLEKLKMHLAFKDISALNKKTTHLLYPGMVFIRGRHNSNHLNKKHNEIKKFI